MALLFADGFDHYAIGNRLAKWSQESTGTSSMQTGRFGSGQALRQSTNTERYLRKDLGINVATLFCGFAVRHGLNNRNDNDIFRFLDTATVHVGLVIDATNAIRVFRGSDATVLATTFETLQPNTWYYIEFGVTIADSGSFSLRVNGVPAHSASDMSNLTNVSADTRNGGNASANAIQLVHPGNNGSGGFTDFDDLYVCDSSGSTNNTFLGDVRVLPIYPDGNGNSSGLVGDDSNSTNHYQHVDDTAPDDDTSYVQGSTPGDKDTYTYTDLSGSATVYGVQVMPYAKKTDGGSRTIVPVARLSTTEVDGSAKNLGTSYSYHSQIYEEKPGGGAWTVSDVNSAEFGVKVDS